jgi:Rieske Fe-S protein
VKLFTLGGDGIGYFWNIVIQNGNQMIISGTDYPMARLAEPIPGKILAQSIVVDNENSQLIIRVAEHKLL